MSRSRTRRFLAAFAVAAVAVGTVAACSSDNSSDENAPLRIVASSVPHAEILKFVEEKGLLGDTKIEVSEITGDLDANEVLEAGDTDANFFQHVPYQESWSKEKGVDDLVAVAKVHVEPPLGAYSKKVTNVADLRQGATVALSNNVTNFARGLYLLQQAGLIKLDQQLGAPPGTDITQISEKNIIDNPPKGLTFTQVDPPAAAAHARRRKCRSRNHQRQLRNRRWPQPGQGRPGAREGRGQPVRQCPDRTHLARKRCASTEVGRGIDVRRRRDVHRADLSGSVIPASAT